METQENHKKKKTDLERVVGIIFIIPPILGVILFLLDVFISFVGISNVRDLAALNNLSSEWTGYSGEGGSYTSVAPIYLGLMAIAGALLLKESKK